MKNINFKNKLNQTLMQKKSFYETNTYENNIYTQIDLFKSFKEYLI